MELKDWVKLSEGLKCPNCDDVGFIVVPDDRGGWEEQQCQFCYQCEDSIFRRLKDDL